MHLGVELLAGGVELRDAVAREHGDQLLVHELDALGEVVLALARRGERALEVVDHRQQLAARARSCARSPAAAASLAARLR